MAWCPTHGQHDATTVGCRRCESGYPFPFPAAPDPRDTELSSLRARIAAAIARCGELHKAHDRPRCGDPYADGYDVGVRQAVAQLRAVLEGER